MRSHYVMLCTYSTAVSSVFNIIPDNTDAFIQFWHEFKNSVTTEIVLLTCDETSTHHFTPHTKHAGMQFRLLKLKFGAR
jgi:hypothetical protein